MSIFPGHQMQGFGAPPKASLHRHMPVMPPSGRILNQMQGFGAAVPPKPSLHPLSPAQAAAVFQRLEPPPDYVPPGAGPAPTPESSTGLYIGLGIGALVLAGGAYLLFFKQ